MKDLRRTCPACAAVLPGSAPLGLCPKCLADLGESEPSASIEPLSALDVADAIEGDPDTAARVPPGPHPANVPDRPFAQAFGDYDLLEEIARGGMGVVYRARHRSLNRIVAVKMILSAQFAGKQFGRRFRNEAAAAAILQHPNIVAIHDVGVQDGQQFFSMDYVEGLNLAQLVRNRPLAPSRAARYLKPIAEAIHYAHAQGILHRDLKPSNVLIDSATDQPRITDFGLAKRLDGTSSLTVTGQVLGSPSFMPPEQAGSDRGKVGRPSDVYALGGILYFLLTARAPFQAESLEATVIQVLNSEPVSPRLLNPAVPRDLETICLKCLEKEPAKRFQTAQELADELDRFARDEPIHARPVSRVEWAWRWCRRKPLVAGLSAAITVAILFGVAGVGWQWLRAESNAAREASERQRAEENLYVANVRLANEALAANNLVHARVLLDGIAASSQQRRLRGWEWQHLMERCRTENAVVLGKHDSYVAAVALAPDGRTAASLSGDGRVNVWNLATHKLERSWTAHEYPEKGKPTFSNLAIVFSPDGGTIATGGRDQAVRIWEASSGRRIAELGGLSNTCRGLAFSSDGRILGAIDFWGQACLWAFTNGLPTLLHKWAAGGSLAHDIAFSPDGKLLVISGYEQPATVWNISNPQQPLPGGTLEGTQWTAAFSPDGKWLLAAGSGGHDLRRWELPGWKEQPRWPARSAFLNTLAFSADSRFVASGYANGEITLWNMSGWELPTALLGHEDHITSLAFSRDGLMLVSSSRDQTVRLWDLSRKDGFNAIGRGSATLAVCFSADSRYLASVEFVRNGGLGAGRTEHSVTLWEVTDAGLRGLTNKPVGGQEFNVYPAFSPDGTVLAVDDWQNGIQLLAVPSLALIDSLPSPAFRPMFRRDGRTMLYAEGPRMVWHSLSALNATNVNGAQLAGPIDRLALSPDGRTAASTTEGSYGVEVWDVVKKRRLDTLKGHEGRIYGLAFSPDGRWLASTSTDTKVGIWNVTDLTLPKFLHGHSGVLLSTSFSADGQRLAAAGEDGVVRLWDTATWQEVAAFHAHASLNCVAFSPNGHWLAAAAQDGTIRLWHAPAIEEIESETMRTKSR